jgi:hypothetical protein
MRCWVGLAALLTAACGTAVPPLSNTAPSPEALAREVLSAVHRGDLVRLEALALSAEEFRLHVWPELPAARPERNVPISYVWGDLRQKSETRLGSLVARHRGRAYHLTKVRFEGPATDYGSYRVHRGAIFTVNRPDGPADIRVCGSMLEKDGRWKVFSFVVDD